MKVKLNKQQNRNLKLTNTDATRVSSERLVGRISEDTNERLDQKIYADLA